MGMEYETLISYADVQWSSQGKFLMKIFWLSEEMAVFFF